MNFAGLLAFLISDAKLLNNSKVPTSSVVEWPCEMAGPRPQGPASHDWRPGHRRLSHPYLKAAVATAFLGSPPWRRTSSARAVTASRTRRLGIVAHASRGSKDPNPKSHRSTSTATLAFRSPQRCVSAHANSFSMDLQLGASAGPSAMDQTLQTSRELRQAMSGGHVAAPLLRW